MIGNILKPKSIHFNHHQCAVYFSLCWENIIDGCSVFIFSLKEPGDLFHLYMEGLCHTKLLCFTAAKSCVFTSIHSGMTEGYRCHCGTCSPTLILALKLVLIYHTDVSCFLYWALSFHPCLAPVTGISVVGSYKWEMIYLRDQVEKPS